MKYKNIIAMVVMMGLALQSQARTDITNQYLTNAGLTSLSGWSYGDNGYNYTDWKTDGDVPVIEFYNEWSTNPGTAIGNTRNFHFTQTITLPAGNYRLVVNAFYREGNGTGQNTKAYIFAGDKTQYIIGLPANGLDGYTGSNDLYKAANAFSKGAFSNELDFSLSNQQQIVIGLRGYIDTYCSWCILGPLTLYRYTDEDYVEEERKQLVGALERFENDYNLADGTDYSRTTMSAEAWSNLIKKVNAVSVALDDASQAGQYLTLRDELAAEMDAVDRSLRLFKSYQAMTEGAASLLGMSAAATDTDTDATEQAAITRINSAFQTYAINKRSDFSVNAFLGENLDFNTPPASMIDAGDANWTIADIPGWEEVYENLDGWCFIQNNNADYNNQLYMRANWTGTPMLKLVKERMLPEGQYRLSMKWNSTCQNMTNLSQFAVNETTTTIGKSTTQAQTLSYEFTVGNKPQPFSLIFGFQKKNTGNSPAQIVIDDVTLTYLYSPTTGITDHCPTPTNAMQHWYTIDGRRLNGRPTGSGIYIHQGKKIIIK